MNEATAWFLEILNGGGGRVCLSEHQQNRAIKLQRDICIVMATIPEK